MSDPNNDDPFAAFGQDRTVIKPSAGRATTAPQPPVRPAGGQPPVGMPAGPMGKEAPMALEALTTASLNPLVAAAMPLLSAAPRVRHSPQHPNPAGLKEALAEGIRTFEAKARAEGLPNEQVIAGRYILCTLLDEAAASTPWGGSGAWASQSLLVQFHNESWGGEKVFALMAKLAENVPANRNLLELLYVCLAFGFEGRYRVIDNGRAQLDGVRSRLAQMLRQGQTPDPALSPRWQGAEPAEKGLRHKLPLWAIAAATALLLLVVYGGLRLAINGASDEAFAVLRGFDVKTAAIAAPTPPPAAPRLAGLLDNDIKAGLVQVNDLADKSIVTIKGDGLFNPGSAEVSSELRPLVLRIAEALQRMKGPVLVTGHTDNQPIRSLRFPSNWHLSQARAEAFRNLLSERVEANRLRAEGRADAEAVADNATPAGRSKNRRVEVTLMVQDR
ncbi:DotU family type VI secretion system protein [Roseateles asaccharophilus]|uniref:Type VI secretion system protein ImpK n=1 Tax=Roseateles asaccharophilus TaxID=582607 RepID=A0ABU2A9K5_9BURK|nr:DotU family type VI secretion system protein [Roseateles asaccharophilus]MDR7333849.1 type VI secretion system protein ImpK [Roseateles asaccharophilus]